MFLSELIGKRLLVLGGMRFSCEIVRKARSMGIIVGVADYNSVTDSPGKQIADEHYEIDITDVNAVVSLIREACFDGVIVGFNDMLLPYYAEICNETGLPCYGTKEQFEVLTDKKRYKSLCKQFGIPTIPEYDIKDSSIEFPVLVKPVDNSGSRGISICHNAEELRQAYDAALAFSKSGQAIIEKYMDGREVTVFWIFEDGRYYLSALANRHVKSIQDGNVIPLPVGYTFPSSYLPEFRSRNENNCKSMFHYLGLMNGMMFMQCKVQDDRCYVYDIGYRLTGSLEYDILERVCDFNPLQMLICYALTGSMCEPELERKVNADFSRPAFNVSCLCSPGTIDKISGIDEVMKFPEVEDVVIAHCPGETISDNMKGLLSQITVRVLGSVESKDQLYPVMNNIKNTIQVISVDGRNLMLPGIEEADITGYVL